MPPLPFVRHRDLATRMIQRDGRLTPLPQPAPESRWSFPAPLGDAEVVILPFTEGLAVSRHLRVGTMDSWLASAALRDIRNPDTPPPQPNDEQGRSAQQFVVDVVIAQNGTTRRATATGRDIYAVTAPIVVEATERLIRGRSTSQGGVVSLGEIFDARHFLAALDTLSVSYDVTGDPLLARAPSH